MNKSVAVNKNRAWKTILIYGFSLAALTALLKFIEYNYFIRDFSFELIIGLIALLFTALGTWVGLKLTRGKRSEPTQPVVQPSTTGIPDENKIRELGLSRRELEVLQLIEKGLSNQEIAEKLFLSPNTVKTHSSNLFVKLDVKRRTQAVQRAKELGVL